MAPPILRRHRGATVLRVPGVRWSFRFQLRPVLVTVLAGAAAFAVLVWSLSGGRPDIAPWEVVRLLAGGGDPALRPVLFKFRLARGLGALYAGAALGVAGVLFQRITRNPLATPDLIGVTAGATAATAGAAIVGGVTGVALQGASLGGGLTLALVVYVLARRSGVLSSYRLVLVGVGLTYLFTSITAYLVSQATLNQAQRTVTYLVGSLGAVGWFEADLVRDVLLVTTPVAMLLCRGLRAVELGDDAATALGTRTEAVRLGVLACGSILAAAAAAAFGPVAFVALLAASIGRGLAGDRCVGLLPAAAVGALLVVAADLAARELPPHELPVGVVTAVLGAPFLIALLVRAGRTGELG